MKLRDYYSLLIRTRLSVASKNSVNCLTKPGETPPASEPRARGTINSHESFLQQQLFRIIYI